MARSRPRATRAPDLAGESFVVIELPIARNWALLVNHKRGEAFRVRASAAFFWEGVCAHLLSRRRHRHGTVTARRLSSPAESHHLDRRDPAFDGLSAPDPVHHRRRRLPKSMAESGLARGQL